MEDPLQAARQAMAEGRYAEGVALAREVLETGRGERHGEAHLLAGVSWCLAGAWADAEEHLLQALALNTQRGLALYHLAMCYEHMRRIDTAATVYRHAAEALAAEGQTDHATYARHNAAWMLLYHGQAAQARELLPTSLAAVAGGDPYELALLAYYHWLRGDIELSRRYAAAASESEGAPPWVTALAAYVGALVAHRLGEEVTALALLETGRSQLATACDPKLWNLYSQLRLA